jgi:acyl-CoA thioester hydrolase
MNERAPPARRDEFPHHSPITTRWADNDAFGHINNVQYYAFFDTAVTRWLVERGFLHVTEGEVVCFVAETGCRYFRPLAFPEPVSVGMRVARLGTSSIRYELAVFGAADEAAAQGHFTHVTVNRASGRPVPMPALLRAAAEGLMAARREAV